ncbi:hypothetical protein [Chitinophaga polysaccharea]|uniref:hypothetical protein n=1 Tax=Chitinophaga polysaccharea TaxID=1293035 RepID=UPI0011A7E214|nr:hypothetical protein [Chitinophaga polysaccharea]
MKLQKTVRIAKDGYNLCNAHGKKITSLVARFRHFGYNHLHYGYVTSLPLVEFCGINITKHENEREAIHQ